MEERELDSIEELQADARKTFRFMAAAIVLVVCAYAVWFGWMHGQPFSTNASDWANFGAYVGGIIGPLVAYFALQWLFVSVRIQQTEMRQANEAMRDAASAQAQQGIIAAEAAVLQSYNEHVAVLASEISAARLTIKELEEKNNSYAKLAWGKASPEISKSIATLKDHIETTMVQQTELVARAVELREQMRKRTANLQKLLDERL